MIFRLSQKLCTRIKAGSLSASPPDDNPFADWSAHMFVADRTQYIIVTNTKSLYSTVLCAKGITNYSHFIVRASGAIRELVEDDGQGLAYHRFIVPASGTVRFAKALNPSVTSSMTDLVIHAKKWLSEGKLSPFDVGLKLNDIPFSSLGFVKPREAFRALVDDIKQ